MILRACLCYFSVLLITAASLFALAFLFKKTGRRLFPIHVLFGALAFIAVAVCVMLIISGAFSGGTLAVGAAASSEAAYKITVALLIFAGMGLVRFFALSAAYFGRDAQDKGVSFMSGFGLCGLFIVCIYCLFMLAGLLYMSLSQGAARLAESAFVFGSGASLSVFTPFYSHILFALVLLVYGALNFIIALFMDKRSRLPYKKTATLLMYLITHAGEAVILCLILFSAKLWLACIVGAVLAALETLALRYLYRYEKENPYERQFED